MTSRQIARRRLMKFIGKGDELEPITKEEAVSISILNFVKNKDRFPLIKDCDLIDNKIYDESTPKLCLKIMHRPRHVSKKLILFIDQTKSYYPCIDRFQFYKDKVFSSRIIQAIVMLYHESIDPSNHKLKMPATKAATILGFKQGQPITILDLTKAAMEEAGPTISDRSMENEWENFRLTSPMGHRIRERRRRKQQRILARKKWKERSDET